MSCLVFPSVSVIGLGLIGGSIARAIRHRFPETRITGVNTSPGALRAAVAEGVVDRAVLAGGAGFCLAADADLVVVSTPVDAAAPCLDALAPLLRKGAVVTDACSTKSAIMARARRLNARYPDFCFIGGHPMAGSEKAGFFASGRHLLENAVYLLCPPKDDAMHLSALKKLEGYLRDLGALPLAVPADEHDLYMAAISHLPHVAAAALVNTAREKENDAGVLRTLAAGGFRDITRIASSSPRLWRSISMSNRERLLQLLRDYIGGLETFCGALEKGDAQAVEEFFAGAKAYRESFAAWDRAVHATLYELSLDVEDRPGVVAGVTGLLENRGINIKNLYIAESREMEGGCLRLAFSSRSNRDRAAETLFTAGYRVYRDPD